jgi:aminopeptidase N
MNSKRNIALLFLMMVAFIEAHPGAHASPPREPSPTKCRLPVEWLAAESDEISKIADEDYPPPPSGDRGYDIRSYDLDIQLFPAERSLTGKVDIGLTALDEGLVRVRLDLVDELTCDGVSFRGREAIFTHEGDSLVVALDAPLATVPAETLTIRWHGRPPRHGAFYTGLLFRAHDSGTPQDPADDVPMVFNQNQPWSAHSWWPCKDHPSDKALVSLTATVPEPLMLVSNGTLLLADTPGPGLRRFAWREAFPIATYLVSVAATNYVSWSEDCHPEGGDPVRLDFHVYPHDLDDAEIDLAPTCDMLELMVQLAGPYPFPGEKYAQAEIKWFGSMEHQTATSMSQIVFTGDSYYELVVIHELAHMWFGDSLTPSVWADIWLNEGFARYCEALWIEHAFGIPEYQEYMREIGPERHPDLFVNDGILLDPDPILPNSLIYDKGAWVVHMLRMLIGDDAFFRFLADYTMAPELVLGNVTLADMIRHAEIAAGRDLGGFFEPWVGTSAVPLVNTSVSIWKPGFGNDGVEVRFTQQQDPLFEIAVPVVIHTACETREELVILSRGSETFTWPTDCPVESVSVDPHGMVLMKSPWAPPPPLQVVGPWPNPVPITGAEFRIYLIQEREVIVKLYDARGRLVGDTNLGLMAATGPADDPDSEPHVWAWPGNEGNPRLPAGVYWAEFNAAGARAVRKLTYLN